MLYDIYLEAEEVDEAVELLLAGVELEAEETLKKMRELDAVEYGGSKPIVAYPVGCADRKNEADRWAWVGGWEKM